MRRCCSRHSPAASRWATFSASAGTPPWTRTALIPDEHRRFLRGCLDYHETDTHIFAHAGYDPDLPMVEQTGAALRWESLRYSAPGPHASGKTVIVGHTAQKGGEVLDLGHLICIDTYCHGGGWLTALYVNTGDVWREDALAIRGLLRLPGLPHGRQHAVVFNDRSEDHFPDADSEGGGSRTGHPGTWGMGARGT
jgi:hypothetical protein